MMSTQKEGNKMKNSMLKKTVVAAACAMAFTSAQAQIVWQLSTDSLAANPDNSFTVSNTVVNGVNQVGMGVTGLQAPGIYGAGFVWTTSSDFSMRFDSDLVTWDSYSPNIGGNTGYFDGFIVSVSQTDFYWNMAQSDPVNTAGGNAWSWGGQTYGDAQESYFCNLGCTDSIFLNNGAGTYYVSLVLDTKTTPDVDSSYASWGTFQVTPVPEPEIYAMMAAGLGLMGFVARRRKKFDDAVV